MHRVKIESHYGRPIILEQCRRCGGIWFDASELHSAKEGEAAKVELLDSEVLRAPSPIQNLKLSCPKDQTRLVRFQDKYFPEEIVVERCIKCDGFWLKRGEFTKYQKARHKRQRVLNVKKGEDKVFEERVGQILAAHKSGSAVDVLGKLGRFLSAPIDPLTLRPTESANLTPAEERTLNTALNILSLVLNIFTRV